MDPHASWIVHVRIGWVTDFLVSTPSHGFRHKLINMLWKGQKDFPQAANEIGEDEQAFAVFLLQNLIHMRPVPSVQKSFEHVKSNFARYGLLDPPGSAQNDDNFDIFGGKDFGWTEPSSEKKRTSWTSTLVAEDHTRKATADDWYRSTPPKHPGQTAPLKKPTPTPPIVVQPKQSRADLLFARPIFEVRIFLFMLCT